MAYDLEQVEDGPDEEGNYYSRPGKLTDPVPDPYPNEQAARVANFGSYPPDLTVMVNARKRGIDYLFSPADRMEGAAGGRAFGRRAIF